MSASKIAKSQLVASEKEGPYSKLDAAFIIIIHPATTGDSSSKNARYHTSHSRPRYDHIKGWLLLLDQIMASANPLMPTKPSKLPCERRMLPAAPVEAAVEGLGEVVGSVEVLPEVEVALDEEEEFPVAEMKTPPAMAGGETVLAFTAAAW